ncbi:MAG: DUF6197 family protein [Gemmataceae bacterium]
MTTAKGRRLIAMSWCQGATANEFDPLGAIGRAVLNLFGGEDRYIVQNYYKAFYALAWDLHTLSAMVAWNNDPARLKEHVVGRFDRAIERSAVPPVPHTPKVAA